MSPGPATVAAALAAALALGCGAPATRPEPPVDPLDGRVTDPAETPDEAD